MNYLQYKQSRAGLFRSALLWLILSFSMPACVQANELEKLTLFQFSQVVAKELDYAIIFSPRVRKNNRIGLVLSEPLSGARLYNVFLSVLNSHGYAAVKNGRVLRIVREFKARTLSNQSSGFP